MLLAPHAPNATHHSPVYHDVEAEQLERVDTVWDRVLRRKQRHNDHLLDALPHRPPVHTLLPEERSRGV